MVSVWQVIFSVCLFVIGMAVQEFWDRRPRFHLIMAPVLILVLPPWWSLGLVLGLWLSCAFAFEPPKKREHDQLPISLMPRVCVASGLVFLTFLYALLFLWKLKMVGGLSIVNQEVLSWIFLIGFEIGIYRFIARINPRSIRIKLGYGMAIINFCTFFYWLYPFGTGVVALVFLSLLVVNPLLLNWIDPPVIYRRGSLNGRL